MMNLFELIHGNITSLLSNPPIAVTAVLVLVYLLYFRIKTFIVIFLSAIAAVGVITLFSQLMNLGLDHKPIPFVESQLHTVAHEKSIQECPEITLNGC